MVRARLKAKQVEEVIHANVAGVELQFETAPSLFSPTKLDRGSVAMLACISFEPNDKVLDLGCGYGLIGIYAAKVIGGGHVWMADNDQIAVECAAKNLALNGVQGVNVVVSDGFREIREANFTKIVCNPPYHVDFSVPKHFIEKGFNRLVLDGTMYVVTKRKLWYQNKLRSVFGGARVHEVDSYLVFEAVKKSFTYAHRMPRAQTKMAKRLTKRAR
jgi:16S rRNA (guanine1207-N2)-methyltransferase